MSEELVKVMQTSAVAGRLTQSLDQRSLRGLIASRGAGVLLLVDCSGSMGDLVDRERRKVDALREVIATVQKSAPSVKMVGFGLQWNGEATDVRYVTSIPEPCGGTPLDRAIDFAKRERSTHVVVVSDGEPNSQDAALASAKAFGGRIDVMYIGRDGGPGAAFLAELAKASGGGCSVSDLKDAQLQIVASTIVGYLTA